jgi:hypothetical protein
VWNYCRHSEWIILVNYENFSLCRFDGKLLPETFLWRQLISCLVENWIISDCNKNGEFLRDHFYCGIKKIHRVKNEMRKVFNFK